MKKKFSPKWHARPFGKTRQQGIYLYTGETHWKWETRQKEHRYKVRLTTQDIEFGNTESATTRINTKDGGLANHSILQMKSSGMKQKSWLEKEDGINENI